MRYKGAAHSHSHDGNFNSFLYTLYGGGATDDLPEDMSDICQTIVCSDICKV